MLNKILKLRPLAIIALSLLAIFLLTKVDTDVNAMESFDSTLSIDKDKIDPKETFELTLTLSDIPEEGLDSISYSIGYNGVLLMYVTAEDCPFTISSTSSYINLTYNGSEPLHDTTVTLKFYTRTTGTAKFTLSSSNIKLSNGGEIASNNTGTSLLIKVLSTNSNLLSLEVLSGGKLVPSFDPFGLQYTVETTEDKIVLKALPNLEGGRISSGDGSTRIERDLQYGENIIQIHSTSEKNVTKIYTITVIRVDTRDSDASLASIEGVENFNKDIYTYDINLPTNQGVFEVSALASKITSKVEYNLDPNVTVSYGETKTIKITVTAENGNQKTYTVNITRNDSRSTNSFLKSLSLEPATINFKKDNYVYRVVVDNSVTKINIKAEAEDNRSTLDGVGEKPLAVGTNMFRVTSTAENGESKVYTITVLRKNKANDEDILSRNTKMLALRLNGKPIQLQDNIYSYLVSVENDVAVADFEADLEDPKALAMLDGNRNLKVGINKFSVIITAENGDVVTYEVIVERKEARKIINNNNSEIISALRNSTDAVITVNVLSNDTNRVANTEILKELVNTKKTIIYEVKNENNGLLYSVTINGENITNIADFNFNLTLKSENKEAIDTLTGTNKAVYLDFAENTNFQGKAIVKVYVGNEFDAGNNLTLKYYDKENNKLESKKDDLKVKNRYTEFEIDKIGEYVLYDKKNTSISTEGSGSIAVIGIIALAVVIIIVIVVAKKKH